MIIMFRYVYKKPSGGHFKRNFSVTIDLSATAAAVDKTIGRIDSS